MYVVYPMSASAREWVTDNVEIAAWQWLGTGFAVHHSYLSHLVAAMQEDGLLVEA